MVAPQIKIHPNGIEMCRGSSAETIAPALRVAESNRTSGHFTTPSTTESVRTRRLLTFKLTDRWDFRAGFVFFHFSNALVAPSDPRLDSLTDDTGFSYHFGEQEDSRYSVRAGVRLQSD
jgi:hypothetical protein